ncbi:MAG: hypothetical protein MGG11_11430 [Trichodesmium sp. MAG_R03]|nr:hypothetical protein [Trichodesmium sp. MAG_R03]
MSHEIIAINRPIRPKQTIESNSHQERPRKKIESKPEKSALVKKTSSKIEDINQPSQLQRSRKPSKPKLKESIKQATNAHGKVFNSGDKILVSAPWNNMVEAEITGFYKSPEGSIWAIFIPQKSLPNWKWEKGCIRAELLKQP